jgi:hypothetical protein
MKIRLHIGEFELSGYQNARIMPEHATRIDSLDFGIDRGEADEIIVEDVVDYIPISKVEGAIKTWSELVKKQGRLVITGTDLQEVAKAVAGYNLSIPDANMLLYGDKEETKKVAFSITHLCAFLKEKCGLRILKKRVNGFSYAVEAQRQ